MVLAADLDGGSPPKPTAERAILPRVCEAGKSCVCHRRGPRGGSQGQLGEVYRQGQFAEPVPSLPQPQNDAGAEQKTAKFVSVFFHEATSAHRRVLCASRQRVCGVPCTPPPALGNFRALCRKTAWPLGCEKCRPDQVFGRRSERKEAKANAYTDKKQREHDQAHESGGA